ncbi:D-glycerate dehydrogenase [Sporosarcina gallistercoris]|uniref:2-hydroxyacid dehydrogenase n=1 Tax=Sporosarcina gallistercoris TaxID=2762245 RepID=UPI003D2C7A5D
MKPKLLITRKMDERVVAPLQEKFNVRMWESESEPVPREVLLKEVTDADALWVVISDRVDRELIETGKNLKVIANMAVGYNNIDLEAAKEQGVLVTNTPDVLSETTADLTFALLLSTARQLTVAESELRKGNWKSWSPMGFTGMDVGGATLGIVGMGRIGEAVARRAKGFNMDVLYHNRNRKPDAEAEHGFEYRELDRLLEEADFVVLLTPYTPETAGLIGARELGLMKRTAVLINVSRGGIVDETALYSALKDNTIWAAGLDVFETEPVSLENPLLSLPNVTVLPHIGSASIRTRLAMMNLNAQAIVDVLEGRAPKNIVR